MTVKIINNSHHLLPEYQTEDAAGMDLRAFLDAPITLLPLQRALIKTGLFLEIPKGYEAQIRPRSGLAFKHGITVLNSPGTIDADYRGEIGVLLINLSNTPFTIEDGERIAQLVFAEYKSVCLTQVTVLEESQRGSGGFGSTGKK